MDASVRIPLKTCVRREPNPQACTPPGFEWLPGYLNQYGGEMTDYARNWFIDKWEEPYRAALESAEREYLDCLQGGVTDTQTPGGLQLRVASKLAARTTMSESQPTVALSTQVNVHFTPLGGTPPPCDPFDPNFDPDHPIYPVDPNAPPVSVPRSVFWKGASATYDLDALTQAIQPVNSLLNPANPLSLRDLQLTSEGVQSAVRITGHSFLPIPAKVQVYDDLQIELEVASIRLEITAEWANNGAVLDSWSAISPSVANSAAYTDFYCYYLGCSWWTSPPPLFNWGLVPPGCLEDLIFRALPTAITLVRIRAGSGEALDTLTLSINHVGTIDSRPIVARHRIFNSPGTPHMVLPEIAVGPAVLGVTQEVVVALPECLVGKVELASDTVQDFGLFQSDGVIGITVLAGATPETIKLRLTLERHVYHWDRDVDIRFIPIGGVDVGYPPQGWWPHVILRIPVSWNGCDAFHPDIDSQARVVIVGWSATDTYSTPLRWLHTLTLRILDYAAPCDAFDCVWGYLRVTWPNGTEQTQQIMCVAGDIDLPRVFTLRMAGNAPPTVNVELTLYYEASNRRRQADGTDFDYLPVPGPAHRTQTLTP
ncbi:MAG: hypothetical protein Q8O33_02975 [Pseudomonadota bacterium]|nr:hypothetical protein [Pseudomonadota bacterium]